MNPAWVRAMMIANHQARATGRRQCVEKRKQWLAVVDLFMGREIGYNVHPVGDPLRRIQVSGPLRPDCYGLTS